MNDVDNKPLTKKDLIDALREVDGGLREYVHESLRELEEGLREYVHDTETQILKAFHVFSSANERRLGQLEYFGSRTGERLADLEKADRFAELELRVAESRRS